jgi:steroid 5-alpha reductase family enzyme
VSISLLSLAGSGLAWTLSLAVVAWAVSVPLRDVSIVDSLWSWLIAGAGVVYLWRAGLPWGWAWVAGVIALVWALRLSGYIAWRHRGRGEDRRYQAIRARNQPNFALKSLWLVFLLQAVLAWVVSAPLLALAWLGAQAGASAWGSPVQSAVCLAGALLALTGTVVEAIADAQMGAYKALPESQRPPVMDQGLWRYSRHPNYFGECCVWWGLSVMALGVGGYGALVSAALMTWLLLKVSGVTLLEKDLSGRSAAYQDYVRRTPAFVPGRPRPPRLAEGQP